MDFSAIPLLNVLTRRMSWLDARQSVLSQNVANADTPGYLAQDLKPADFSSLLKGSTSMSMQASRMAVTEPGHLPGVNTQASLPYKLDKAPDNEANPTGNTVGLEQEMIKVADTQAQYTAASNLYAKTVTMMRTAIGQP